MDDKERAHAVYFGKITILQSIGMNLSVVIMV